MWDNSFQIVFMQYIHIWYIHSPWIKINMTYIILTFYDIQRNLLWKFDYIYTFRVTSFLTIKLIKLYI